MRKENKSQGVEESMDMTPYGNHTPADFASAIFLLVVMVAIPFVSGAMVGVGLMYLYVKVHLHWQVASHEINGWGVLWATVALTFLGWFAWLCWRYPTEKK